MKSYGLRCIDALVISLVVLLSSTGVAATPTFDRIIVFGDSLSDIGNDLILSREEFLVEIQIPPPERYTDGRFSNGSVWVEQLAKYLDIKERKFFASRDTKLDLDKGHSVSYAYGGSGTFAENDTPSSQLFPSLRVSGLLGQVADFANDIGAIADSEALYVLWSGANDYLLPLGTWGIPYPPSPESTVENIVTAIDELHTLGARHFLVLNLPDLGNIPLTTLFGPEAQAAFSQFTELHNAALLEQLKLSSEKYADSSIYHVDVYSLFSVIADNPHVFGFTNTFTDLGPASNCLISLFPGQDCSELPDGLDAGGSVFWDSQHPTAALHRYIGLKAYLCLSFLGICRL